MVRHTSPACVAECCATGSTLAYIGLTHSASHSCFLAIQCWLQLVGDILDGSNKGKSTHKEGVKDHTGALDVALHYLQDSYSNNVKKQVSAIGHRVVHGKFFDTAKLVTPEIEKAIEDAAALAPLHNPPNLQGITAANSIFPGQPQVRRFCS